MPTISTNSTNNPQRHSPVYNTNNNSSNTTGGGGSNGRNSNNSGSKRRLPTSHTNNNSYVNNVTMSKFIEIFSRALYFFFK
jgi:hypothetical protein